MKLFLVRHAEADSEIPEGLGDESRALLPSARSQILSHFGSLQSRVGKFDVVYTSPSVRCVQTATLFTVATGFSGPLEAHPRLLPNAPTAGLVAWAQSGLSGPSVWFGHNPHIGVAAAHLLGLTRLPWPVSPGTVIGLERVPEGPYRLSFFASPGAPVREILSG